MPCRDNLQKERRKVANPHDKGFPQLEKTMTRKFKNMAAKRDPILFGEPYDPTTYKGHIRQFENLPVEKLELLVEKGLIDKDMQQNGSPTTEDILDFIHKRESDGWYVDGYAVAAEYEDFRTVITGVGKATPASMKDISAFAEKFHFADIFEINEDGKLYCYYD